MTGGAAVADRGAATEPPAPEDSEDPVQLGRRLALRRLASRACSRHELAEHLRRKGVPEAAARTVLDRLEQVGLVDDEAFARDWVTSRQERRRLSATALRQELRQRGVPTEAVEQAVSTVGEEQELAAARRLVAGRRPGMVGLDADVRYRRLAAALARRGYPSGLIARVLAETDPGSVD